MSGAGKKQLKRRASRKEKKMEKEKKNKKRKVNNAASSSSSSSSSSAAPPSLYPDVIGVVLSFLLLPELNKASQLSEEWSTTTSKMKSNQYPFTVKNEKVLHSLSQSRLSHHLTVKMDESVQWWKKRFTFESVQFLHKHTIQQATRLDNQSATIFPKNLHWLDLQIEPKKSAERRSTELQETVAIASTLSSLEGIRLIMDPISSKSLTLPSDVFEPLRKLTKLETFECADLGTIDFRFHDAKLFRSLPALKHVSVWKKLTPSQLDILSAPPHSKKFTRLGWSFLPLTKSHVASLTSHSELQFLICRVTFPPSFLSQLNKIKNLGINFDSVNVDVSVVTSAMSSLTSLEQLDLQRHPGLREEHVEKIVAQKDQLEWLRLWELKSLRSLSFLSNIYRIPSFVGRRLTSLLVIGCKSLPPAEVMEISYLSSLKHVDVSRSFNAKLDETIVEQFTPGSRLFKHLMSTKLRSLVSFTYSPR